MSINPQPVPVLGGYVQLIRISCDILPGGELRPVSDLFVANDARATLGRTAEEFGKQEERLVGFLGREEHTSPFRGGVVTFRVKAPLMVARQWFKYAVGSDHDESMAVRDPFFSWNEESRRYVDSTPEFYVPNSYQWRNAPEKRRQGSGEGFLSEEGGGTMLTSKLSWHVANSVEMYEFALASGVAPEQARLFLPAYGLEVTWVWTSSLQGVIHFLDQRLAHDAQSEIRQYAEAVLSLVEPIFPVALKALLLLHVSKEQATGEKP